MHAADHQREGMFRRQPIGQHVDQVAARLAAFFERTDAPLFDPHGDNWFMQGFNKKHFAYKESLVSALGEKWWEK